jgi:hypothetical protein
VRVSRGVLDGAEEESVTEKIRKHVLKCWSSPFEAMRAGRKTFEYRLNDRDFQVGDRLLLQEYEPEARVLTGESLAMRVVYLLAGGAFGVPEGYCVMGVEPWKTEAAREIAYQLAWSDGVDDALDCLHEPGVMDKGDCIGRLERLLAPPGEPPQRSSGRSPRL